MFYTFKSIGDDETNPKFCDSSMKKEDDLVIFYPRKNRNIVKKDSLDSLTSLVDM